MEAPVPLWAKVGTTARTPSGRPGQRSESLEALAGGRFDDCHHVHARAGMTSPSEASSALWRGMNSQSLRGANSEV